MKKRIISLIAAIVIFSFTFICGTTIIAAQEKNELTKYYCLTCHYQDADMIKVKRHIEQQHLQKASTTLADELIFKSYKNYVSKNKVNIYSKPNKKSKIVKKCSKGKKVTIIEERGNWRRVGINKWIHKSNLTNKDPNKYYNGIKLQYDKTYKITKNKLTKSKGINYYNGSKETWYSQNELSGKGLSIPGRHVANDGTIRDKDGYLVIACSPSYKKKGTKMMTSLGPAIVRDCGCAYGVVDIYVAW